MSGFASSGYRASKILVIATPGTLVASPPSTLVLVGAKAGDIIEHVDCVFGVDATANFESIISVDNEIQQIGAADYSTAVALFVTLKRP